MSRASPFLHFLAGPFRKRDYAGEIPPEKRNRARLKNRRSEQKSGLGDRAGQDDRGELAMFGVGAHGSSPISFSNAGNRGSARKSSKPAQMQYSRRYAMLPFSCSMPCAKQAKASS